MNHTNETYQQVKSNFTHAATLPTAITKKSLTWVHSSNTNEQRLGWVTIAPAMVITGILLPFTISSAVVTSAGEAAMKLPVAYGIDLASKSNQSSDNNNSKRQSSYLTMMNMLGKQLLIPGMEDSKNAEVNDVTSQTRKIANEHVEVEQQQAPQTRMPRR